MLKFNVDVTLSLDGPASVHDKNRKFKYSKKGSFEKILTGLKTIPKEERKKITIFTVITPETYRSITDTSMFLNRLGFRKIKFFPNFQFNEWKEVDLKMLKNTIDEFKVSYSKIILNSKKIRSISYLNPKENNKKINSETIKDSFSMRNCDKLSVDFNGNFYPCDRIIGFPEIKKKKWCFGNIDTDVDLSLRQKMLNEISCDMENLFPGYNFKKPFFCPFSFYLLGGAMNKVKKIKAIAFCFRISDIYEDFFKKDAATLL